MFYGWLCGLGKNGGERVTCLQLASDWDRANAILSEISAPETPLTRRAIPNLRLPEEN
jgi:hypothetical protein